MKLLKYHIFRPKFRSYKPQDESLKNSMIDDAKPGDVEGVVQEQLDAASSKVVIEELVSYTCTLYIECSYANRWYLKYIRPNIVFVLILS